MFREQVEWELQAQELASLIVMYFAPATKAPITLLELGLFARSKKIVVCCPDGFWRKGNVEIVCDRYQAPMVDSLDQLCDEIHKRISLLRGREVGTVDLEKGVGNRLCHLLSSLKVSLGNEAGSNCTCEKM